MTSDKKLVVANWKQNKDLDEAKAWAKEFAGLWGKNSEKTKVLPVVCPPAPFLSHLVDIFRPVGVPLGAQDVSAFPDGAHTGEIGVRQLKGLVNYAIVGHSERGEDRQLVEQKASICLESGIIPIVCFKSCGQYTVIEGAVYALEDPENISRQGVYRPKAFSEIKDMLKSARVFFGAESKIIYGGSVNEENSKVLATEVGIDGVLVGHASLNPNAFYDIVSGFLV